MSVYVLVLYCHLLGALALFIGYGIEWVASALFRKASSTEQVRAWLAVFRVSPPLSGAGLGMLILSGGYLASLSGAMKQGWIPATLVGIAVALLFGIILIQPRMRAIRKSLPSPNEPLSAELRARLADPLLVTAVRVRFVLAAGMVYVMVAKLPLRPSLTALALSLILGPCFSISVWRRGS